MGRRSALLAVSLFGAVVFALLPMLPAAAAGSDPKPIPGGFVPFPGGPFIHVFAPGPVEAGFMGLDVEPNTITDFKGFSALAYPIGTATDADGNSYVMFNDMRVFSGTYVSMDGSVLRGTFAFI
jgi:hypothetical protein